jgi:hypothetical protein
MSGYGTTDYLTSGPVITFSVQNYADAYVFVNNQEVKFVNSNNIQVENNTAFWLLTNLNRVSISPSNNPDDPNALKIRILYVPWMSNQNLANSSFLTNGVFGQTSFASYQDFSPPIGFTLNVLNLSPYFALGIASQSAFFTDSYGRYITGLPADGINGTLQETLIVSPGSSTYFAKPQGLWQNGSSTNPGIEIGTDGYIHVKPEVSGEHIFYLTTERGHVSLTLKIEENIQPIEVTYFCFPGQTIIVDELVTGTSTHNGYTIVGGVSNSTLIAPSPASSTKFDVRSGIGSSSRVNTFNIVVLQIPVLQNVTVGVNLNTPFYYQIVNLLGLNPNIGNNLLVVTSDGTNQIFPNSNGLFNWPAVTNQATIALSGMPNLTIIANVRAMEIDLSVSTIYARQGRSVNLFNFFSSKYPGSTLLDVYNPASDNIISSSDGTLVFGKPDVLHLSCKLLINGVDILFDGTARDFINVVVISDSAITAYVTSDYQYQIILNSGEILILIDDITGEHVQITDGIRTSEAIFTSPTPGVFNVHVIKQCLLLYGNPNGVNAVPTELYLVPVETIITGTIELIKDGSGNVNLVMPHGPTYLVDSVNPPNASNPNAITFDGGSKIISTSSSVLYMSFPNLNKGTVPIVTIRLLEGERKVLSLVNSAKIINAVPVTPLPSGTGAFISVSGSDLLVTRNPKADMSITFVVQDMGTGKYVQYIFKILPPVKTQQKLEYTTSPSSKYKDILPGGDYEYSPSIMSQITNGNIILANAPPVMASYGELSVEMTLVEYDGKITNRSIYLKTVISNVVSMHNTSGQDILPTYTSGGVTFTSGPGTNEITVTKSEVDDQVGQYFFVSPTGVATLYNFKNIPAISHPDVYVFSGNSWIADADIIYNSIPYAKGSSFPITANEVTVTLYFSASSPYAGENSFAFNIIKVAGNKTVIEFSQNHNIVFTPINIADTISTTYVTIGLQEVIESYMIEPPERIRFAGSVSFRTQFFDVKILNGTVVITTITPGKQDLFIITKDSTGIITTHIFELIAYSPPFGQEVNTTYYLDEVPSTIADLIPSIQNIQNNTVITGPTGVTSSTPVVIGENNFEYDFFGDPYFTKVNISVIPKPETFTATRIIKKGVTVIDNIIKEQYGNTLEHALQSVTTSASGLSVSVGPNNTIVMSGTVSTFPGTPGGYPVTVTVISSPSASVRPRQLVSTITVFVWDPVNVKRFAVLAEPSIPATVSISNIAGTLQYFDLNGEKLEGTSNGALDWSLFSAGSVRVSSKRPVVTSYFLFTSEEVVLFTVIVLPLSSNAKTILFPNGSSVITGVNILDLFYPGLADPLVDAGVDTNFTNMNITFVGANQQTSLPVTLTTTANGILTLTNLTYTCKYVLPPTLIDQTPEFVIPVNQSFTVTSLMVSPDSVLSTTDQSVRNTGDGIIVFYGASQVGTHTVSCILTRDNTTQSPTFNITFTVYDPKDTEVITKKSFLPTFSNQGNAFSTNIISYTVDNVTYNENNFNVIPTSKYIVGVSGGVISVKLDKARTDIVVTVKLSDGKIGIFQGTYMLVNASTIKVYMVTPTGSETPSSRQSQQTVFSLSDLETPGVGDPVPTIIYDPSRVIPIGVPSQLPLSETLGYPIFSEDGRRVGWITAIGSNVTFYPDQPGIWNVTGLLVQIGMSVFPIYPYIETVSTIIAIPKDITAELGSSVVIDVSDFVLPTVGSVIFTEWKVDGNSTLPTGFSIINSIIKTQVLTTARTYTFSATIQSTKTSDLTLPISFKLVAVDPNNLREESVVLVESLSTPLSLGDSVVTINGKNVTSDTLLVDGLKIVINGSILTISALVTLSGPVNLMIVTTGALQYNVVVKQVSVEKDISVIALGYSGNLFLQSPGSTVTSYTASGSSLLYSPGQLVSIGQALVTIMQNGRYNIENATGLTLTINYLLPGGAAPSKPIVLSVGPSSHPVQIIEQGDPQPISLGSKVIRVIVAGQELDDGETISLGFANFTRKNNDYIKVSDITPGFQPTLVQAENDLKNKINVVSMIIDLKRDVPTQLTYLVPLNSTVRFNLSFEPSRVTYGDLTMNGSGQEVKLFTSEGILYGNVVVSGSAVIITSKTISAFSKAMGFMDSKGAFTYAYIKIYNPSENGNTITPLKLNDVIQAPSGVIFETAGLLDGSKIITPPDSLEGKVQLTPQFLSVIAESLTSTFTFYTTLSNGIINIYTIKYENKEIFTSDLTRIPIRAIIGSTIGTLTFTDPSLSIEGNFIKNPNSLRIISVRTPIYGQFTINILRQ